MIMSIRSEKELRKAHEFCLKTDFQEDFINRCQERRDENIGLCNLPLGTLSEQQGILDVAFSSYQHMKDCNVAFNDTLDAVIDKVEKLVANGKHFPASDGTKVVIIIEEGIVSAAYSSQEHMSLEIVELDKDYADTELRDSTYDTYRQDSRLSPCEYRLIVPGYECDEGMEVEE